MIAAMQGDRRAVRVRCKVILLGAETTGYSVWIGRAGMQLAVAADELEGATTEVGARVELEFRLPDEGRLLRAQGRVERVTDDASGQPATGLDVGFEVLSPADRERLHMFLADYRHTVLLADADASRAEWIAAMLGETYRVLVAATAEACRAELQKHGIAVLILGDGMAGMWDELAQTSSPFVCVHLSPLAGAARRGELVGLGRWLAYLSRPLAEDLLPEVVENAIASHELRSENARLSSELEHANKRLRREHAFLRQRLTGAPGFERIIGNSPALRQAIAQLERIRKSEATVHVQGETGTGKELVARALHLGGRRNAGPFVAQNCGGMTESLLQSTLFGHKKGAFTGADKNHAGVFAEADKGTLFLDEVAELTPATQASLLRALQEREVVPLGASRAEKVDVRVVSATHKDLKQEVKAGRFREDLYFRLVVITVALPPLRARAGDVPILAQHFLDAMCTRYGKDVAGIDRDAMAALERYDWPGNIRELENEIERMVVLVDPGERITTALLSPALLGPPLSAVAEDPWREDGVGLDALVQRYELGLIRAAMAHFQGNLSAVAKALQIPRTTLRDRLRKISEPVS
jgi:DNA-binding NtrC family response regulator